MADIVPVIIVGAGGHGTVVADALMAANVEVAGFSDNDPALAGRKILGRPVLGVDDDLATLDRARFRLALGIGGAKAGASCSRRRDITLAFQKAGWSFVTVRHPSAIISPFATIGYGCQIMAAAVVQAGAQIGDGVILNTQSIVEHDAVVGAYSHVSIGGILCGGVRLGEGCHVGAGAVIRQNLVLASNVTVGMNAAVVTDCLQAGALLVGVPARLKE